MIAVIAGTTGELIKLAPVMERLQGHYLLATTAQQASQVEPLLAELGLPGPDVWLARGSRGRDLESNRDVPRWLASVARGLARNRRTLSRADAFVVHGDTMTTLLGAVAGRLFTRPVVHIEAGLRSGDLRHPFPEEGVRRLTSRLASLHYAPGAQAAAVVSGRGAVVDTGTNTIRDALNLVPPGPPPSGIPPGRFGVVSLHRYELINDRRLLAETLDHLRASPDPLVFVDHPVTVAAMRRHGLDIGDRIPRLGFFDWVRLLRAAAFVVTDSGGAQEECFFLDRPCLVHRRRTERTEGLGETSLVSEYDLSTLTRFLAAPDRHVRRSVLPPGSASDIIAADLRSRVLVG